MSLQEITSDQFLSEEGLALAKSAVAAIVRSENRRAKSGGAMSPPPETTERKIAEMLDLIASGIDIEIIPVEPELTVSQVGDFLRMTENHVNDLLNAGRLAFRMNGNERMILRESLLEFERKREQANAFLNELLEMSQEDDD